MYKPFLVLRSRSIQKLTVLLLIVLPLLASVGATPANASLGANRADIIDGRVDVNEDGVVNDSDDAPVVQLAFNDAALIRVGIINGSVDVNESGVADLDDDLLNADLTAESVDKPRRSDQVDVINALIDVNEDGATNGSDDLANIILLQNASITVNRVDIINGQIDSNEDGAINGSDDAINVLLAFNGASLIQMDIANGSIDVNDDDVITETLARKPTPFRGGMKRRTATSTHRSV